MYSLSEEIRKCTKCSLCNTRTLSVPGEGPTDAKILIVGEGPGAEEDRTGIPFVGRAGKLLNELLKLAGLERENVFIANCVKCRPPGNRNPNTKELQACKPWLEKQIELINPKLIILLGRVATKNLINKEKISEIHGEIIDNKYFVTFHPSAGLRFVKWKLELEKDFTKLKEIIKTL